jgi:hypothetical protein
VQFTGSAAANIELQVLESGSIVFSSSENSNILTIHSSSFIALGNND